MITRDMLHELIKDVTDKNFELSKKYQLNEIMSSEYFKKSNNLDGQLDVLVRLLEVVD